MRKWWILLLLVVCLTACSAPVAPADSAASKKVLFVGREGGGDALVVKRLKGLGYEVYVTVDKELTAEKALNNAFVFVSSTVNSGKVSNKLKNSPVPVIYAEGQNMGDVDLAGRETDVDHGNYNGKTIAVKKADHPMAAGLKDIVDIYQAEGKIGFVVPGKEGVIIASAPDDERRAVICAFEKGAKNRNNEPVPARQVYFYLIGGEEINQTDNGWKLFDAAVRWTVGK